MKYLQSKANKIVKLVIEWELSRSLLKYIISNVLFPWIVRQFAVLGLSRFSLQSSLVHHKFRCRLSGQSRSVISFFHLNRMRFKIMAASGLITGIKKNSK